MTRQLNESRNRIVTITEIILHGSGWPEDEKWRIRPSDDGETLLFEFWNGSSWGERGAFEG